MDSDEKIIKVCFNGKKYDKMFEMYLSSSINSLRRLKDTILSIIKVNIQTEKLRIFNYKGIEIDDADIDYLSNGQYIYISLDGSSFSTLNYIFEYEIIKEIKSGGYGKVYLAKQILTDKLVAIKQNDVTNLSNEEIYNISREALYLESLKHKNIIKYINSYNHNRNFYTVMQYAEGGELGSYVNDQTWLIEPIAKKIFIQLVDAIKYIHSKNIVHRDLKPNNILFSDLKRENIVIIDFGISGYSYGNIHESVKAGTVKFIPPEVASGTNFSSSSKIDIWALGIILYYMLFGILPFEGKNDIDISKKIIKDDFQIPVNIPITKACYDLLKGLLEKNPQLRIDLISSLIDDWIDDNTFINYNYKKDKQQRIADKLEKELFELKLEPIVSTSNIEEMGDDNIVDYLYDNDQIVKEPAKFDNEEVHIKDNQKSNLKSLNKIGSVTNIKPKGKNSTIIKSSSNFNCPDERHSNSPKVKTFKRNSITDNLSLNSKGK